MVAANVIGVISIMIRPTGAIPATAAVITLAAETAGLVEEEAAIAAVVKVPLVKWSLWKAKLFRRATV